MIVKSQFKPPWWLSNRHAQTIWQSYFRKQATLPLSRTRYELPDDDFLDIDQSIDHGNHVVVILHGLEGKLDPKYSGMLKKLADQKYTAILMYHRSCSGEINRLAKSYHSGFTDDIHFLMQQLKIQYADRKIILVGYSLGGSVALNYLAKFKDHDNVLPDFSYIISVPFRLQKGADKLNIGFSKIYREYLLKRMKDKVRQKKHLPDMQKLNIETLLNCKDFNIFDHEYTAKVNGFNSSTEYYSACSSRQYLKDIQKPTHILHSNDDPFMLKDCVPKEHELSDQVTLELCTKGGHVGFIYGNNPFAVNYWSEDRLIELINRI